MSLPTKDPAEIITVEFDFTALAASVSAPTVTVAAAYGKDDATASAMLSGSPSVTGAEVRQRIIGGQSGTTYTLRCVADAPDGSRYVLTASLPVETATPE
ncbi:MAG: hypothetical protein KAX99_06475 [Azonexus sp.]|nr:hypothetical protein [Azonexus sp.]